MKVIFSQILTDEKHNKMVSELNNNENFNITYNNFHEFFDCNYELDVLKEKNIDYKVLLEDSKKSYDYKVFGKILISDEDYESLKEYFNLIEDYDENNTNDNNDDQIINNNDIDNSEPIQNYQKNTLFPIIVFIILIGIIFLITSL